MRLGPVIDEGVLVLYGDYNTNTGPIDVLAVDPTGTVTTLLAGFDTEETQNARLLTNGAWLPAIDPRGGNPASLATNQGGTWHTIPVVVDGLPVAVHLFDVTLDGTDLLVCGSRDPDTAFVWRSTDSGATWAEDLAHDVDGGGYNRFYEFGHQDGAPVVTTTHGTPAHYVLTAGEWVPAATVDLDPEPEVYDMSTLPSGGNGWTASAAEDGATWLCDGDRIYLFPPPD